MSVDVRNESGVQLDLAELSGFAAHVMTSTGLHPDTELCVLLVDEPTMSQLNARWMGEQRPTDVLAFPMDELRPNTAATPGYLGDLAVCPQVAIRQANQRGVDPADELRLLTVHGVLHLLGHDHAAPDERTKMFALQGQLLEEWRRASRDPAGVTAPAEQQR